MTIKNVIVGSILFAIVWIFFLSHLIYSKDCRGLDTFSFRNIRVRVPISALDVKYSVKNVSYGPKEQINADSIIPNIRAEFVYGTDYNYHFNFDDTDLKYELINAVTFKLLGDINQTDEFILSELQKTYPGEYTCAEHENQYYYLNKQACLTIVFKRNLHHSLGPVPEVTFCHQLADSQIIDYAF